ncbi:TPA: hypothetical protein QB352_001588 [Pasteurella multocida]|nr:hypothetical protein [Pasteurella multocida]
MSVRKPLFLSAENRMRGTIETIYDFYLIYQQNDKRKKAKEGFALWLYVMH